MEDEYDDDAPPAREEDRVADDHRVEQDPPLEVPRILWMPPDGDDDAPPSLTDQPSLRAFPRATDPRVAAERLRHPPKRARKSVGLLPPRRMVVLDEPPRGRKEPTESDVEEDEEHSFCYYSLSSDATADSDIMLSEEMHPIVVQDCVDAVTEHNELYAELLQSALQHNRRTAMSWRADNCAPQAFVVRVADNKAEDEEDAKLAAKPTSKAGSSPKNTVAAAAAAATTAAAAAATVNHDEIMCEDDDNEEIEDEDEPKIILFGTNDPANPPLTSWVPIERSFWSPDQKDLQFLPSLEMDEEEMSEVLSGFKMRKRNRKLKYGPPALQAKANEKIDRVLGKLQDHDETSCHPRGMGYPHLIGEHIGEPSLRVEERIENLTHERPRRVPSNSFRDLWCSRCCIYDCHRHSLARKIDTHAEITKTRIMLDQERNGAWSASGITVPPLDGGTFSTELSEGQKIFFKEAFYMFEGDVFKVSNFLRVKVLAVMAYVEKKRIDMPTEIMQPLDPPPVSATPMEHYSIHNYTEAWYTAYGEAKERPEFTPCYHAGLCDESNCTCIQHNHFCTTACIWGQPANRNFFRGCGCRGRCVQRSCSCYAASRECDPNLCSCQCCSDPAGKTLQRDEARNDNILMERGPVLGVRKSHAEGAGWGCFTLDALRSGDYVGEYVGELISQDEAERRGAIADANKKSFLFNLTPDTSVDSSKYGNMTRFINDDPIDPNVEPKILFVKGEQRIAFFAKKDIGQGEELFFDYRYSKSLKSSSAEEINQKFPWLKDKKRRRKIIKPPRHHWDNWDD